LTVLLFEADQRCTERLLHQSVHLVSKPRLLEKIRHEAVCDTIDRPRERSID
jgi:hypothetical protein